MSDYTKQEALKEFRSRWNASINDMRRHDKAAAVFAHKGEPDLANNTFLAECDRREAGLMSLAAEAMEARGWRPVTSEIEGFLLVTNNVTALDAHGKPSHVWYARMVHAKPDGEFIAYAETGWDQVRSVTHYIALDEVLDFTPPPADDADTGAPT